MQNASSIDLIYSLYEMLCQLINYLNMQLDSEECKKIVEQSIFEQPEIGASFGNSFDEMKKVYAAKLKYLLKFNADNKSSVRLELDTLIIKD